MNYDDDDYAGDIAAEREYYERERERELLAEESAFVTHDEVAQGGVS